MYGKIEIICYNKNITRKRIQIWEEFNMVENLRVVEKDEEIKEVNEELKKEEKEAILKEYEDTLGY